MILFLRYLDSMVTAIILKDVRRVLLALALLSLSLPACPQNRKIQNRPFLDDRVWHYGFLLGVNLQDIELENNGLPYMDEQGMEYWYSTMPEYTPGLSVGILGEYKLSDNMSLRMIPTMHFGDKKLVFCEQKSGSRTEQYLKSTLLSIPFDLKVAPLRFNNNRPYFVAGLAPTFDLTRSKGDTFLLKGRDCLFEIGMGCDLYYQYFKLIPELKFCFGLYDIHEKSRTDLRDLSLLKYSNSIDRAYSRMIVLSLYFE